MKRKIKFDPKAIREKLKRNEEGARGRSVSFFEHPLLKAPAPGEYRFRATYYPHSEDVAAQPFPVRYYHFGLPGAGIVWCPQKNSGEECAICDFVWSQMKAFKGNKEKVKFFADKLPKARVWVPGKARNCEHPETGESLEREKEGVKFLTFGTREDKMSAYHEKLYKWFVDEDTADWLDPDEGFDLQIKYEEMPASGRFKASVALAKSDALSLARKSSPFGDDYMDFLESIPDIDDNEIDILKAYTRKTTEETFEALQKWQDRLDKPSSSHFSRDDKEEVDTGSDDESALANDEQEDEDKKPSKAKSSLKEKLRKMGVTTE